MDRRQVILANKTMDTAANIADMLRAQYSREFRPDQVIELGAAGGFSGARFWRLVGSRGEFCLRRWPPEHPTAARLAYIHGVLNHVWRQGFHKLPLPVLTVSGQSFFEHDGHLWELAPWMPGEASYRRAPSEIKLRGAMEILAQFHAAAARHASSPPEPAASPGVAERLSAVERLLAGELSELRQCISAAVAARQIYQSQDSGLFGTPGGAEHDDRPIDAIAHSLLSMTAPLVRDLLRQLQVAASVRLPLQPAIRDIWHDHVLYEKDAVSGIVDFGSLRVESICGDIARLLGSLAGDDNRQWQIGLAAYQNVRPLSAAEQNILPVFDRGAVVLSGIHWIEWLYRDRRQFSELDRVKSRLVEIETRLRQVAV